MAMQPPFKCLFCLSEQQSFTRIEHPIPESLGNDDLFLIPGFVCDSCNQYFGSKVENHAINAPPFNMERVASNVKTKKGKTPTFEILPDLTIFPTGFQDTIGLIGSIEHISSIGKGKPVFPRMSAEIDFFQARLLLKMAMELLILTDGPNPYESRFNNARRFARAPQRNQTWQVAWGIYPNRKDLIHGQLIRGHRGDELDHIKIEQLYQYSLGIMPDGDVQFNFIYRTFYFVCNLSNPSIETYVREFNAHNLFELSILNVHTP